MYVTPEQITATNKAGIDAFLNLAHTQFAAFEKLSALNFNATKAAFEESVSIAKAITSVKDVQELVNLNASLAQPTLEKAHSYSRNVYEVLTATQGEYTKAAEGQASEFNNSIASLLDKVTKNAPAGSDVAVAAVKSALAAANTAYDSITKVAKQATEIAQSNFAAATAAVSKETKKKAI